MTLVTELLKILDRGIWKALTRQYPEERWDSHVRQKFQNFWIESLHLHCKGGGDEETERKEWTAWCGLDEKRSREDSYESQWVFRTQKW